MLAVEVFRYRSRDGSDQGRFRPGSGLMVRRCGFLLAGDTGTLSKTEPKRQILHQQQTPDVYLSGIRRSTLAFMPERTADESMNQTRETTCR